MGYICIGATDSKENIVMFKDSDNCELLDDVITAKCKLSGSKIANFNKDTNSPMLYICEFIREYKDYDEQFYSRILSITGAFEFLEFFYQRKSENGVDFLVPDDNQSGSTCRSWFRHKEKRFGEYTDCKKYCMGKILPQGKISYALLSARNIEFRFDSKDFDKRVYSNSNGVSTIFYIPKFLSEIDFKNLLAVSKVVKFFIDYVYSDGTKESIDVEVTVSYSTLRRGWVLSQLDFPNLDISRVLQ